MDATAAAAGAPALATVDVIIIIGFLVLVTIIGYMMSNVAAKGMDDYFLGGKRIPWWVLGISTATSNFDMAGTMAIISVVFALGFNGFLVAMRGGVGLSLAFLMVFLGKWLRRSRVMTSAEWMKLRFGTDRQGKAAHIFSAVAQTVLALGMIIYFGKGAGSFLTEFLPLSELTCTAIMVGIGLFYTLMAGLYGVVFTDVVQMIILTFTAIFVSVHAFVARGEIALPQGFTHLSLEPIPEGTGGSLLATNAEYWQPVFTMFGICVVMWFARTALEGMGGVGGYTDQRFFAARTEREASLLTLESIILSLFRWTMIAALVILGFSILQAEGPGAQEIASNSEKVLPIVLRNLLPAGIRGLVIAGLIAAAMSTFDSTLNAGASYLVRDVYQSYVRPNATARQLMRMSRIATVALCVVGVALSAVVENINAIWNVITMGIGAGMFVPSFLRWIWPRFNGYGFAVGTGFGLVAALIAEPLLGLPLYASFPIVIGAATLGSVATTLLTQPTAETVLVRFYVQINPWGPWGRYRQAAAHDGQLDDTGVLTRIIENLNHIIALCFAIPFQLCLLLAGMSFMFHAWEQFASFLMVTIISAVGLYFFWYRNLKADQESRAEDERFGQLGETT